MATVDGWAPEVYARFASDRSAPFEDLLSLLSPARRGTLLDLGCGTGALTAKAHAALQVSSSLGLESSTSMLSSAALVPGLTLEQRDIANSLPEGKFDRVLSNSAFNWIPDHRAYLPRVLGLVAPGGELGVQMPSNQGTPFSDCMVETAADFSTRLEGFTYHSPVESPEVYSELLARDERVEKSRVGTWYYPQLHPSIDGLVAFAQGGMLSAYRARLSPEDFEHFCSVYRERLLQRLGSGPVFFAFRRVFLFARLKAAA